MFRKKPKIYSYVQNRPMVLHDPTGGDGIWSDFLELSKMMVEDFNDTRGQPTALSKR